MSLNLLIIIVAFLYTLVDFLLIGLSVKFSGINPFPLKSVFTIGVSVILFSWLTLSAFIYVPIIIKPLIIVIAWAITIYIFISFLDTHILRSIASGAFFLLCQVVLFIFLLKHLWNKDFFQIVKIILFQ